MHLYSVVISFAVTTLAVPIPIRTASAASDSVSSAMLSTSSSISSCASSMPQHSVESLVEVAADLWDEVRVLV